MNLKLSNIFIIILIFLVFNIFYVKAIEKYSFPKFSEKNIIDTTNQLSIKDIEKLSKQLEQYLFSIKAVFITNTKNLNLLKYTQDLFKFWKMDKNSVLLVIAIDRKQIGMVVGDELEKSLKNNKSFPIIVNFSEKKSFDNKISKQNNLIELIPPVIDELNQSINKDTGSLETDYKLPKHVSVEKEVSLETSKNYQLSIILIILCLIIVIIFIFLVYKIWVKKRDQENLKEEYSFDLEVIEKEIITKMEEIEELVNKLTQFQGYTRKNLEKAITISNDLLKKGDINLKKIDNTKSELSNTKNLDVRNILDELKDYVDKIDKLKEELKTTNKKIKKVNEYNKNQIEIIISEINVIKNQILEITKLYNLPLTNCYKSLEEFNKELDEIVSRQNMFDPVKTKKELSKLFENIKEFSSKVMAIPHILNQLNNDIKNILDDFENEIKLRNLNHLIPFLQEARFSLNLAINKLKDGDFNPHQENLNIIFDRIDKIKTSLST